MNPPDARPGSEESSSLSGSLSESDYWEGSERQKEKKFTE